MMSEHFNWIYTCCALNGWNPSVEHEQKIARARRSSLLFFDTKKFALKGGVYGR